jgi:hypothetical protein
MGPLGLGNRAFDSYKIDLPVIVSAFSLGIKVIVGTSGNCEDCNMGGKGIRLLWSLLDLRWRFWRWVGIGYVICGTARGYVIYGVDKG